jgi:AraC family transcriptional regulator, regulatory protein of adaptative response / DNA-3-methyladenine glycosylase II
MPFDHDVCYRAVASRDRRFDGRFFTGVLTTGVYCRPICPARTPHRQNVRFFPCAAAAEEAGFRPCRRCRPETSPGTPAWLGTSATVSRALRLIMAGALDGISVDELADRLGIGARHLRRLFLAHLGASPSAIARTRRVHFARKLIDETDLPMTEVAHSSQFASVRRFNAAVRSAFGSTPSELRHQSRHGVAAPNGTGIVLQLPFRRPYQWDALLGFLAARAIPGVEEVKAGCYRRAIEVDRATGVIEVTRVAGKDALQLRIRLAEAGDLSQIVGRVRRMFDLDADPLEIAARLRLDPLLAPLVTALPGVRVPGAWDPFEITIRAILGQQVSVKAATTLAGRLVKSFGRAMTNGIGGPLSLFPRPEVLAEADLTTIGLTRARTETVNRIASAVRGGTLSFDALTGLDDAVEHLTAMRGVGPWTAQYIAMRALGEPDAFPASDLGLLAAVSSGSRPIRPTELAQRAEAWRPWRAYAAMLLWQSASRTATKVNPAKRTS